MAAIGQIAQMLNLVTGTARVETVYGEPREVVGKVIIPVARVTYGGGGGGGLGKAQEGAQEGSGGGGGMGVNVQPLGILVITEDAERWVPVLDVTRLAIAGSAVVITGLITLRAIFARRRYPRKWERA